ncbi:SWI/SNF complex protein [Mycena floridula]|nr:SWI/SNF complex protein [Mycena floridula]
MYQSLLDMERKLDWTMTRKRVEIQDTLARIPTVRHCGYLYTVSGQPWQVGVESAEMASIETGESAPAWVFKIEGWLLESTSSRKGTQRKFSTFVKRMVVERSRDPALYQETISSSGCGLECRIQPWTGFHCDELEMRPRKFGLLYLEHFPEQYKIHPDLGDILGFKEDSRLGVIRTLWNYIKIQGLEDKVDRRLIRTDDRLGRLFGKLPELVNKYQQPREPIVLYYNLNPTEIPSERPMAWDVEIKTEDTALKNRMHVLMTANKDTTQTLTKLDEEIALMAQLLHNSHLKRTFLQSFSKDLSQFITSWLESQSRDLESILGSGLSEGLTVRQEELRRIEFFKLPWVEEAVAVQEGLRLVKAKGGH